MSEAIRASLRGRFATPEASSARAPKAAPVNRAQKNLTLPGSDIARLEKLAKRDRLSQARLIARALDAYEELYGRVQE